MALTRPSINLISSGITTSNLVISNTTPATSNITGALVVSGGVGIAGNVYAAAIYSNGILVDTSNANTVYIKAGLDSANANIAILFGTDVSQNNRMSIIEGTDVSQNARMAIIEGVDVTQNTNISNKLSLTGSLNQTVSGNVTISQDLIVSGNLILTGNINSQNVQQLAVADPLILLGLGNYLSDTKDIGFAAHYNDGTNAHAGLIRDSGTKEFYVFQGYIPEVDATNNIDINDVSFVKANLNAGYVKSNLIATTAVVNGLELYNYSTAVYAQANVTAGGLITANANTAITQGVDLTQNTNIALLQAGLITANANGVATDGKMQSAYNQANVTAGGLITANANTVYIKAGLDSANANIVSLQALANSDYTTLTSSTGTFGSGSLVPVVTIAANGRVTNITTTSVSGGGGGSSSNSFSVIKVSGQPDLIANTPNSPLTLVAGSGIILSSVGTSNTLTIASTSGFSGGTIANQLIVANSNTSTSTTTGALQVQGGVGITGNAYSNAIYTNGLYYAANNQPIPIGGGSGGSSITIGQVTAIAMGFALP
jgi:hypothetical protein